MSALHAWGQDLDLDKLALNKLGLVKPVQPLTFGVLSRGGHMSLLLPGWNKRFPRVQVKVCRTDWDVEQHELTQNTCERQPDHVRSYGGTSGVRHSENITSFASHRDTLEFSLPQHKTSIKW